MTTLNRPKDFSYNMPFKHWNIGLPLYHSLTYDQFTVIKYNPDEKSPIATLLNIETDETLIVSTDSKRLYRFDRFRDTNRFIVGDLLWYRGYDTITGITQSVPVLLVKELARGYYFRFITVAC